MKKILPLLLSLVFAAFGQAQTPTPVERATPTQAIKPTPNADNTARNAGVTVKDPATADQQPNNESDLKLLQSIRKEVIEEKSLSMAAKNCKIIVNSGAVTLRGPVESAQEKQVIEDIATRLAGSGKVTNELEVKAPK